MIIGYRSRMPNTYTYVGVRYKPLILTTTRTLSEHPVLLRAVQGLASMRNYPARDIRATLLYLTLLTGCKFQLCISNTTTQEKLYQQK